MIKVGFTGTQHGMTDHQKVAVGDLLHMCERKGGRIDLHHGDCIGADEQVHNMCAGRHPAVFIVSHPPLNNKKRAWCRANSIRLPEPYMVRNKDIVDETDVLIATPFEREEIVRSGTWSTVRYAERMRKPVFVVTPDGCVLLRGNHDG